MIEETEAEGVAETSLMDNIDKRFTDIRNLWKQVLSLFANILSRLFNDWWFNIFSNISSNTLIFRFYLFSSILRRSLNGTRSFDRITFFRNWKICFEFRSFEFFLFLAFFRIPFFRNKRHFQKNVIRTNYLFPSKTDRLIEYILSNSLLTEPNLT